MLLDKVLEGGLAGEELEEEDAEAVDVGVGSEEAGAGMAGFGGAVEEGGGSREVVVVVVGGKEGGDEAVVGEAGLEVGTKEDVGGLEVAMDDGRRGLVEVEEAGGDVLGDLQARCPVEGLTAAGGPGS